MSFYSLIKNNKDAFDDEKETCHQLKKNIMKHPLLKKTNVSEVSVDNIIINSRNKEDIYCTRVIMFNMVDNLYPLEQFEFCYIPFIHKKYFKKSNNTVMTKYYILIKDMKAFFQTPIKSFEKDVLNLRGYKNIFTVAKTTCNHPTIEDIIVKNYIIHKEIQNDECAIIVSNIMCNLQQFVFDVNKSDNLNTKSILTTPEFDNYRHETVLLLKLIIENEKLKYGVDYEIPLLKVHELIDEPVDCIPRRYILSKTKDQVAKYVKPNINNDSTGEHDVFYYVAENLDDPYGLHFCYHLLPGSEWRKFYEGITLYKKPTCATHKNLIKYTSSEVERYPELKKYLDSLPEYRTEKSDDSTDIEYSPDKIYSTIQDDITIISSTNNTLLKQKFKHTYDGTRFINGKFTNKNIDYLF